ncbi:Serine/threonine-protein kinase ULK2 [Tetrabaena socialis]|uniref:Serine/threonine-protein kinase ULK2 n=1 Tax=Tetrabaena socialis TaxID=47790 RepID=A0A2J8A0N6_9CHLO|nr:Serine/threonine-protein kinase ULK2 [Tetrabaena socialis]|eukprot:PNH06048.1 Serine/threonine-protein kinase ULK2 [Tetrabaena socialis]
MLHPSALRGAPGGALQLAVGGQGLPALQGQEPERSSESASEFSLEPSKSVRALPMTVRELLLYGNQTLPGAIISIIPDMGRPAYGVGAGAVFPPADVQTLSGCGSELPLERAPLDDDTAASFTRYTMITWWQAVVQLQAEGPAVALAPGQQLSLTALSLDLADVPRPFGAFRALPNLALSALFRVPVGASLQLSDVVIVVSVADLLELMRSVCSPQDTDAWAYNPDVTIDDRSVNFFNFTSRAPNEDGVAGEGGEVRWINVQLVSVGFPYSPLPPPLPCAALPVSFIWRMGADGLQTMLESVEGPIYLSLVTDLALQDGPAEQVVVPPGRLLVLLGDPSLEQQRGRRTTLDLGGQEGAWFALQGARLRDLQLVNLPYSSSPLGPYDLLAVGMQSFSRPGAGTTSGSSVAPSAQLPNLHLARCTLVVSDPELAFLSRAAVASASGVGAPDLATLFGADVPQPRVGGDPTADQSEGRLVLDYLQISSLVALSNVTLLSASAYSKQLAIAAEEAPPLTPPASPAADAPPANGAEYVLPMVTAGAVEAPPAPLLPSSLVWPPLSLYDEEVALQWGGSGTIVATRLLDALLLVPACASAPSHRTVLLLPSYPDLLSGAIGRVALSSPITLRDLVLYNLAPGGAYPTLGPNGGGGGPLAPAAQLTGADAVWTNSSLPLWFFQCARSNEDLQQLLASSGGEAGVGATLPGAPASRLALVRVTLVVPEVEWRALAAAVLLQHAPYSMQAAQHEPRRRRLRRHRRLLEEAGEAPEGQAGATAALLGFAAASQVASYNYSSGVLMLADAHWYGAYGSNVTVTYKLPDDAPPDATLLPYSGLVLPYQELAGEYGGRIIAAAGREPQTPAERSPELLPAGVGAEVWRGGGRPGWHVPVVAFVSAVGGVAVLAAAVWGVLAGRRQCGLREGSAGGVAPAAPPTKAGLFLALAPGGAVGPSSSPRAAGCSALATAAAEGISGATFLGSALPGLTSDLKATREVGFRPPDAEEEAASKRDFRQALDDYFGALRDSQECGVDPLELSEQADGHGSANPRFRAYRRTQGPLKDGAELSQAIRTLEAELRDPDLAVNAFLGRGACGMVFGGTWRGLPVAVKMLVVPGLPAATAAALGPGGGGDRDIRARQRAVLEAAISLSMAHPNVVGEAGRLCALQCIGEGFAAGNAATYTYELKPLVHDPQTGGPSVKGSTCAGDDAESTGADAYKLYIVQELCNGESLGNALSAGMAGSFLASGIHRRLALRLAADVALGMAHVHSCRIVHGDLKPDNVLLMCGPRRKHKDAGEEAPPEPILEPWEPALRLTAKVADFGLSLPLEAGATHASRRFQGTPLYSAPEVLLEGRQSPQADTWSFGLLLLELFYGCTLSKMKGMHDAQFNAQQATAAAAAGGPQRRSLPEILIEEMFKSPYQSYAALTSSCLRMDSRSRPTFEELAARLLEMCDDGK